VHARFSISSELWVSLVSALADDSGYQMAGNGVLESSGHSSPV